MGESKENAGQSKDTSNVMRQIDESLRHVYRDVTDQDVPDRFKDLLNRLKEQESQNDQ